MILSVQEVREYVADSVSNNYLLPGLELTDTMVNIAMSLVVNEWNSTPPTDAVTLENFQYKHVLMSGTLARCYAGLTALLSRNTFAFSDGGLSIPLEERSQLYAQLQAMYQADFMSTMTRIKISQNMDQGWGQISSDYSRFPIW